MSTNGNNARLNDAGASGASGAGGFLTFCLSNLPSGWLEAHRANTIRYGDEQLLDPPPGCPLRGQKSKAVSRAHPRHGHVTDGHHQ